MTPTIRPSMLEAEIQELQKKRGLAQIGYGDRAQEVVKIDCLIDQKQAKLERVRQARAEAQAERRRIRESEVYNLPEAEAMRTLDAQVRETQDAERRAGQDQAEAVRRLKTAQAHLLDVQALYEIGEATKAELGDAQQRCDQAQAACEKAEHELRKARLTLPILKQRRRDVEAAFREKLQALTTPHVERLAELLTEALRQNEQIADLERQAQAVVQRVTSRVCAGLEGHVSAWRERVRDA